MILLLATESGKSGEHLPFYIAAGALALWAVVVSVLGLVRKDFPGSPSATKALIGVTAVLMLTTVGLAITTATQFDNPLPRPKNVLGVVPQPTGAGNAAAAEPAGMAAPAVKAGPVAVAADPNGALAYVPKDLSAKAGMVTIVFTNGQPLPHNVVIEKEGGGTLGETPVFTNGKRELKVKLPAGTYTFYCSVPGHRQAGMVGQLTVS